MYLGDVLMLGWSKWNRVAWEADLQKRGLHACLGKGFAFICSLLSLTIGLAAVAQRCSVQAQHSACEQQ